MVRLVWVWAEGGGRRAQRFGGFGLGRGLMFSLGLGFGGLGLGLGLGWVLSWVGWFVGWLCGLWACVPGQSVDGTCASSGFCFKSNPGTSDLSPCSFEATVALRTMENVMNHSGVDDPILNLITLKCLPLRASPRHHDRHHKYCNHLKASLEQWPAVESPPNPVSSSNTFAHNLFFLAEQ